MTPKIITRNFSDDSFIMDEVFYNNKYLIRGQKNNPKKFISLGDSGAFCITALLLGATKIVVAEPFIDNFSTLLENVYHYHFVGRVVPFQCGIYTEPMLGLFSIPEIVDGSYFNFSGIKLVSDKTKSSHPCYCVTLDQFLEFYCFGESYDILRINFGYLEKEVLLGSKLLSTQVNSICGEISLTEEEIMDFRKKMGILGYIHWNNLAPNPAGRIVFWASKSPLKENFLIEL